jgi:Cu-Zn family superoxide dismutase
MMQSNRTWYFAAALAATFALAGCDQPPGGAESADVPGATGAREAVPRQALGESTDALAAASLPRGLARAELEPTQGHSAQGTAEFTMGDGLGIAVRVTGLAPGVHGIHIHEFGDCTAPDGSSAGEHFAPERDPHGAPAARPAEHHLGDLGNITADAGGTAVLDVDDDELELTGDRGVVGRALIVHAGEDDLTTQPSGDSGDPVACGVIRLADSERG